VEREPVPILEEAGLASLPVWTGTVNLFANGILSDRPARSESLQPPLLFSCQQAFQILKQNSQRNVILLRVLCFSLFVWCTKSLLSACHIVGFLLRFEIPSVGNNGPQKQNILYKNIEI
jgi:hypothetical protein